MGASVPNHAGKMRWRPREMRELLPRYDVDNLFDSTKFKRHFPDFPVTSYRQSLENIWQEWESKAHKTA